MSDESAEKILTPAELLERAAHIHKRLDEVGQHGIAAAFGAFAGEVQRTLSAAEVASADVRTAPPETSAETPVTGPKPSRKKKAAAS